MSSPGQLSRFPRPNVAVDLAILTVRPTGRGELCVLVQDRERGAALPGRFIRQHRTIAQTASETMDQKVGVQLGAVTPALLRVFDSPDRDPRGWTLSIAHVVVLPYEALEGAQGRFEPIGLDGRLHGGLRLLFDHDQIVALAVARVRGQYETAPDPAGLLSATFTLTELRRLHQSVLGERLRKDTFNRRMVLELAEVVDSSGAPSLRRQVGRPARLYRRIEAAPAKPDRDSLPRIADEATRATERS